MNDKMVTITRSSLEQILRDLRSVAYLTKPRTPLVKRGAKLKSFLKWIEDDIAIVEKQLPLTQTIPTPP